MIIVVLESKYIMLKDMTNTLDKYFCAHLPMAKREKSVIEKVVSSMYKNNMLIKREENLSTFHKIDPLLL